MAQSEGKRFEEDFHKSIPYDYWFYRFKDNASSFSGGENTRFTTSNICDCEVMADKYLFLIELKSHLGVSIPFTCIRNNQIEEMSKIEHNRIKPYFIFNFRDKEKTYAIYAKKIKMFIELGERKSIPIAWCEENGIEIESIKKKVRYKYNLEKFFKTVV